MTLPLAGAPHLVSGIVTILLTVFAMALTDAFVKYASSDMTLWQIYVCRSALALPPLLLLARGRICPASPRWVALRSMLLVMMYLAIYATIPILDLSVMAAALYTAPLFIVLLSAIFLAEKIRRAHWYAAVLGFVGVLVVVRPQGEEFTPMALVPVVAAALYAAAAVVTRGRCANESSATLALSLNIALVLVGAVASLYLAVFPSSNAAAYPFLLNGWSDLDTDALVVLVIMGALIVGVTVGLARAYQSPHPQIIATFDYAYLIFAAFWGFVFFREVPTASTLVGMVLIAGAGLLVLKAGGAIPSARQVCSDVWTKEG